VKISFIGGNAQLEKNQLALPPIGRRKERYVGGKVTTSADQGVHGETRKGKPLLYRGRRDFRKDHFPSPRTSFRDTERGERQRLNIPQEAATLFPMGERTSTREESTSQCRMKMRASPAPKKSQRQGESRGKGNHQVAMGRCARPAKKTRSTTICGLKNTNKGERKETIFFPERKEIKGFSF